MFKNIIFGGDWNFVRHATDHVREGVQQKPDPPQDFNKWEAKFDMLDVCKIIHPNQPQYTWFTNDRLTARCLDRIEATATIVLSPLSSNLRVQLLDPRTGS